MRRAINHLKRCDPVMAAIIAKIGPYKGYDLPADFESMARSIIFQQLAGAAARTIFQRVQAACEKAVHGEDTPRSLYGGFKITPEAILALSEEQMRACGLSRQKLSYLRDLATRSQSGEIDFTRLPQMSDEEVIEHLTRVKGIGIWSAQMFLIFALKRPDVMPTLDLGVNTAIQMAYRKRKLPKAKQIMALSEKWKPYRSFACWYFWRYIERMRAEATAAKKNGPKSKKAKGAKA